MESAFTIRDAEIGDVEAIADLDVKHGGERKPEYWQQIVSSFSSNGAEKIALLAVADDDATLLGFLFGEIRAWEFGSERCAWIFSVAVDPRATRNGIAGQILAEARQRFRNFDVELMRTMVRRDDVPMASFFRSNGFVAGPYAEMECALGSQTEMKQGGNDERQ